MIRHHFFWLFFVLAGAAISENAEYWIIENPAALVIYDQYEQRLNLNEKSAFMAFSAWQILSPSQLLSDQFTRVVKTRYDKQLYFLQLTEQDALVNREQCGKLEVIKNAIVLNDTIQIKNSGRFFLDNGQSRQPLGEGLLLKRQFQSGQRIFVYDTGRQIYGWLLGGGFADYEIYHADTKTEAYTSRLFQQVNRIFEHYNQRFVKLFDYLNQRSNQSRRPPQWVGNPSFSQRTYLMQPANYQSLFPQTQTYLLQELKDLLHGSKYTLDAKAGAITIKQMSRY
jgi:hypothetical protein